MSEQIKLSLMVCKCCGDPLMVLRGGYLKPEEIDDLELKINPEKHDFECIIPEPGVRVHEFQNPAQARIKYADYLEGLPPHYEKAYGVLTRKSKDCGKASEEVLVEITGCIECEKIIAIASRELYPYEATALKLLPSSGHKPHLPSSDMPPEPYQYEFVIEDECKDDPDPDIHGAVAYLQAHDKDDKQDKRLCITRLAGAPYHVEWQPYDYGTG